MTSTTCVSDLLLLSLDEIKQFPTSHHNLPVYCGFASKKYCAESLQSGKIVNIDKRTKRARFVMSLSSAMDDVLGFSSDAASVPAQILSRDGNVGYLFVLKSEDLRDIEVNEEYVGGMVQNVYFKFLNKNNSLTPNERSFLESAWSLLSVKQKERAVGGRDWEKIGGKLLKVVTDRVMLWLIDLHPRISATGEVPYVEAWQFNKLSSSKLEADASNFFELAERI